MRACTNPTTLQDQSLSEELRTHWTVPALRGRAKEPGVAGYSGKRKAELARMLRDS